MILTTRAGIALSLVALACAANPRRSSDQTPARPEASARPGPAAAGDLTARRQAFAALLAEHWEWVLRVDPESASVMGERRFDGESADLSAAAVAAQLETARRFRARFAAIDPTGFDDEAALTRSLLIRSFDEAQADARFEDWKMPVEQMGGIHLAAAQLPALLPFQTAQDYQHYLTRLGRLPRQLDDTVAVMRLGMAAGLMPPRFLLEKVAAQAASLASARPEESPFATCLKHLPAALTEPERSRLRQAVLAAVRDAVLPAYHRFAAFVREEYAPRGRTEPGIWALPDGAARYAAAVRAATTSSLSPEEIHQLGLREVARIEGEMRETARRAGHADLAAFRAALAADPTLRPTSREQILEIYRGHLEAMRRELPRLFGRLPRADFEVVEVERFREQEAAGAEYRAPAADGSRPGRIEVNTGDFASRSIISFETTAYHEAIPGHHLQGALQQELAGLAPQRRQPHGRFLGGVDDGSSLFYNAYVEGWALYAERLGREVGRFQDPRSYYGHLQDEMLRAIRLVVDTGLHARRWSRQQVVDFFHDHSTIDEVDVQAETDRYIVWPGQALGYKVGQLTILSLREQASRELGPAFDIRRFHDLVLGSGALPLDVLEPRVRAWIAAQKAAAAR